MNLKFKTLEWKNNQLILLDQRKLPAQEIYHTYQTYQEVGLAIKDMVVRGAPAIGVAAGYAMALAALKSEDLQQAATYLKSTRPTAVNLAWAVERILKLKPKNLQVILNEAKAIEAEDIEMCRLMGKWGAELIENGKTYLTHCNAGALATAGQGTALSVFYEAKRQGKTFQVISSETRPYLQGARLTCWELSKNGIHTSLITDNMVAHLMKLGKIHGVFVGSDRIAANGDVANKIGTYGVATLAKAHAIPFYAVAPTSTIDLKTPSGEQIIIEERHPEEVTHLNGIPIAPAEINVFNYSFDVTPHELLSAIITEKGVAKKPFSEKLQGWLK
ncbi:MAG: S-methyl-5-thioribose-1-phosphate isomerase [Deltaproteobacteria bacterium]|nr:S-methyl-5-thioribose-1-phosphate isomerase [Deltaproteobacteria bacterium]